MTPKVRRGRLVDLLGALRFALLAAALIPASLAAHAQGFTLPPPEKVPTFLGIDLPLRPGERLVPIGNEGCSFVVFAPKPEQFEESRKVWEKYKWLGACRFGLAHGQGMIQSESSNTPTEALALYGTLISPAVTLTNGDRLDYFFSGTAFNDLSSKSLRAYGYDGRDDDPSRLATFEEIWIWQGFLDFSAYDASGNIRKITITSPDLYYLCDAELPAEYKAFDGEIKKTCRRKKAGKHMLVRREGSASVSFYNHPVVWMKTCPLFENTNENECDRVLREAIGKDYAAFAAIEAGSPAARAAAISEVFARYASLEQAVEARLRNVGSGEQ
ncbi:MAG: hypothetical protein C0421_03820 [Hyphomonas sp.]|uniref:hypothetical protein n=1 Tax=Hyphomonas sp. TaxID=87 RepID=UPI0025BFB555|nr:hypothetical protein [Hyphomonas sp.]MBA4337954.1 hypothetical protein [Hyphomonas sp.]